MSQVPTREILWNISSLWNLVALYTLMVLALVVGFTGVFRRVESWNSGRPAPERGGNWLGRTWDLVTWALLQRGVVRERGPALSHTMVYIGTLVLLFTTTMVFIDNDLGIRIYQGDFYLLVTILSDVLGFGVLIGCALFARRRFLTQPDHLHNRLADSGILAMLSLLIVQGFIIEGLRIHATQDPWRWYSPIGLLFSKLFWQLSPKSTSLLHFLMWWFHSITVFVAIALIPYSKAFHILASTINLFFKSSGRPKGALKFPGDLEKLMEAGDEFSIGVSSIKDYSWKELMDLDACTSCGRCQDNCPAYISGKPLSPKWLILDIRNHALILQTQSSAESSRLPGTLRALDDRLTRHFFLESCGVEFGENGPTYADGGSFRGTNTLAQRSALALGGSSDARIAGTVLDPDVFWSCTTCMACVEVCPVGIDHVTQVIENRRNMVLMNGELPTEAQGTLRALENRANPYGPPQDRANWIDGFDVKVLKPGDSVDYLYWVGCVSAFDPRKQKIAKALVTIMNRAGLSFGILGTAEGCSGDPARRLGEENLFQTLAKKNIETLKSVTFKTLVANCPHCFNTIKNEYPQLGNLGEGRSPDIIHHSQLLKQLIDAGKLKLKDSNQKVTFHDPCYLGRYNDEYEAPRSSLRSIKGLNILEMDRSKEKAMCCGAGGGHFWMDLKIGERVNSIRVDQAAETGADKVATACPFCMQMIEDGVKLTGREDKMGVKDIAELILESLEK